MTGIAAIFAPGPARQEQLDRMMAAMADRAHDGTGTWFQGRFALGAAMLHTTAESFEAPQPFTNEDASLALVLDGYLTNWEELRADLASRGAVLRNRSDAELVLRAYEQWGEDCANRIEGEFAFVIADQRKGRIFAARDHQGLRPLHFYQDKDALLIASDVGAIIAAAQNRPSPNLDFLANVAAGDWYLRDATVWQGVERVPQAHWLTCDGSNTRVRQYYDLPVEVTIRYAREEEYVEHYRAMLFDAVRRTSRSHQPLAVTVSGGLDSSAIYGIAHQLEQQGRLPAPGFDGYTLAGEEGTDAYELPFARAVADHCGRSLTEVPLFRPGIDWFIDRGRRDCDLMIPPNGSMSLDLERAAFARGSRGMLHGDGGDQWLDGSILYYQELALNHDLSGFAAALRRDADANGWAATLPRALRSGLGGFVPERLRTAVRSRRMRQRYVDPDFISWLRPEWRHRLRAMEEEYRTQFQGNPLERSKKARLFSPYRCLALDIMQRQRGQSGLETREPMQTRQFIEFACATPEWIRNQAGVTKVVHRKAMAGVMPTSILERRSKANFTAPRLNAAFACFVRERTDGPISQLCTPTGLRKLTELDSEMHVDSELGWEVWGCSAVAAFLAESLTI
jgi:asparagine synthase (glutamine-hydrolysing)